MWREDGQHFILARIEGERFLIQDLATGKALHLSAAEFAARYSGKLILVASRASVLGSLAKFDFTWFIPAVIKYRRIFFGSTGRFSRHSIICLDYTALFSGGNG